MSFQAVPALVLSLTFFAASPAFGGEVTPDDLALVVLKYNPELQQAQARVQEQDALVRRVKGGWLPRVTGAYTLGRTSAGIAANTFEIGVSQALFNPALKRAVRQAEAAKVATMKSVESLQLFYIYRAHLAFYRITKAQQSIVIRSKQLDSLQPILKDADTRARIGIEDEEAYATTLGDMSDIETRLELDRQEAQVACQDLKALIGMVEGSVGDTFQTDVCENLKQPDLIEYVNRKTDNARVRLAQAQGLNSALETVGDVEVWGQEWLRAKLPESENPVGTLLALARENRPERFEALSLILSREEEVKGAKAAYLPTVSAGTNFGYSNEPGRTGQFNANGTGAPYSGYATVGITVGGTIFDGSRKGNISAADARLEQQRKNLLRVENQIRQDVENAVTRVKTSAVVLPKALKSYVSAQKAYMIRSGKARLGIETGMVFQNLLLQQNLKVMERELSLFQSIVSVLEQEVQLKYATATF